MIIVFLNNLFFDWQVDMYSLGVIFFELWCPFGSFSERAIVLNKLKNKAKLPKNWVRDNPIHADLLERLLSRTPSDRPSAKEFLEDIKSEFSVEFDYMLN